MTEISIGGNYMKKQLLDEGIIIHSNPDGTWTKLYADGTKEVKRFTKTREVHDFIDPNGRKTIIWTDRK
jgi:hypothetical protein